MTSTVTAGGQGATAPPAEYKEEFGNQVSWIGKVGRGIRAFASEHLNFFRIHVLLFTFIPLIASGIFYAANGKTHIPYIDCLFICVSAMTVTGLASFNISTSTGFQQAIIFFLMCIGNVSAVSVTMVLVRRHFFRKKFDHMVRNDPKMRRKLREVQKKISKRRQLGLQKVQNLVEKFGGSRAEDANSPEEETAVQARGKDSNSISDEASSSEKVSDEAKEKLTKEKERKRARDRKGPLTADMIRRSDQPAVLMNANVIPNKDAEDAALLSESTEQVTGGILTKGPSDETSDEAGGAQGGRNPNLSIRITEPTALKRLEGRNTGSRSADPRVRDFAGTLQASPRSNGLRTSRSVDPSFFEQEREGPHHRRVSEGANLLPESVSADAKQDPMPRSQTIGFAEPTSLSRAYRRDTVSGQPLSAGSVLRHRPTGLEFERNATRRSMTAPSLATWGPRTNASGISMTRTLTLSKTSGLGGWPTLFDVFHYVLDKIFHRKEIARTNTIFSTHTNGGLADQGAKSAPYFSFDVVVTRNSLFHELTEEQRDELGGVEYRAIDLLAKFIPGYWIFVNLFFFTLVAPYVTSKAYNKFNAAFDAQAPYIPNRVWWTAFNTVSAYSNTGLSLIDANMSTQQNAYLPLTALAFLILLGNTAFPIALRFSLWFFSKLTPSTSRMHESLRFLLDHPRRCFVYLFPSGQTWFLLFVLVILNVIDWVMFLILDIGNPNVESIPTGQRVFDGLFQSIAVRTGGFQVLSLLTVAPAVQVLYTVMMYVSVFPIAMSVRSTNVYEERSLGIFEKAPEEEEEPSVTDAKVWSKYLATHARRQLAFDMWWLAFALWLMCIVQRGEIQNPDTDPWFTIFSVLFELTSAYGTVGLSTGTPTDAFSLSGRFNTLGKLIMIAVMLRGRHRGLPVAIDRAILLPDEVEMEDRSAWSFVEQEYSLPTPSTDIARTQSTSSAYGNAPSSASDGENKPAIAAVITEEPLVDSPTKADALNEA